MSERLSEARIAEIWKQSVRAGAGYPTRICDGVSDLIAELAALTAERDEARQQRDQLIGDLHAVSSDYADAREQIATLTAEVEHQQDNFREMQGAQERQYVRAEAAERQVTTLTAEREEAKDVALEAGRRWLANTQKLVALQGACEQLATQARSTREIVYDSTGSVGGHGSKKFGHNPSWVKVADLELALLTAPPVPLEELT